MSKTHSQPLSKEMLSAIGIAGGIVLLALFVIISIAPGIIELLVPAKTQIGSDPIDSQMVNSAIKYISQ